MENQRFLVLRNNKLLKNININQLNEKQILGQLVSVREGEVIYNDTDNNEFVYLVISGKVRLFASSREADDIIIGENDYFGKPENDNPNPVKYSAVALTDTYLYQLSYHELGFLEGLPQIEERDEDINDGFIATFSPENVETNDNELTDFDPDILKDINKEPEENEVSFDESLPYDFNDEEKESLIDENGEEDQTDTNEDDIKEPGITDIYFSDGDDFVFDETENHIVTIDNKQVEETPHVEPEKTPSLPDSSFVDAVIAINSKFTLAETYDTTIDAICRLTDSDQAVIFIPSGNGDFIPASGKSDNKIKPGFGITGWAVQKNEPLVVNDVKTSDRFNSEYDEPPEYQTKSMLVLPVSDEKNEIILIYHVINNAHGNYTPEHIAILKLLWPVIVSAMEKAKEYENDIKFQRMASLKKISGFLDKDIKKPVLVSKRYADHLRGNYLPDNVDKVLNMMSGQLESVVDLIRTITDYTAGGLKLRMSPLYLNHLLKNFVKNISPLIEEKGIELKLDLDTECKVKIDNSRFHIVLDHLLRNAVNAVDENGTITISTSVDSSNVKISIRDNGSGIPENIIETIFEPFISEDESGAGLGLFIAKVITEEHNGTISIAESKSKGAEITIKLPLDKNF